MKALIYARCSTDEAKQDVERQLGDLRRYCQQQGWEFDECFEYGSGYKGDQPKLKEKIEQIRLGNYQVLVVWSMDRFSREHPRKVDELLNKISYDYKCRFISYADRIDSSDEMQWHIMRHMMVWAANVFSRKLSEAVKGGIARKKATGAYSGGRPSKDKLVDMDSIVALRATGRSLRGIADEINKDRTGKKKISYVSIRRLLQKHIE